MQNHIANPVQTKLSRRPSVSARKVMKIAQLHIFTIPYTPVANRELAFPVSPRFVKIVGA